MRRCVALISLLFGFSHTLAAVNNHDVIMRLHGSNTIGAKLGPELVKSWMRVEGYKDIRTRQQAPQELLITAKNKYAHDVAVEIKAHGSGTGFKSLAKKVNDIAMASRPIKDKELVKLSSLGDLTRMGSEFVIGLDGIAVIVNKKNPITELKKTTIRKIFAGEIINWKQIDSKYSGRIDVYARDDKSGTYDTFKALVLGKKSPLVKNARRYESNADLSDDVSVNPMAIGFVGLPYIRQSKALAVVEEGALAKFPEVFDVATEDYPLSRRLYMYVPADHGNRYVTSFMEFTESAQGQAVVADTGFISQEMVSQRVTLDQNFPAEYLKFTQDSERLSLNFRFKKNSTTLDNKAQRDIDRLIKYMAQPENKNKKIMLFGFSEASETLPIFALDLSIYRVDWVSNLLAKKGLGAVRVRGYGSTIPVASNEDAGGRNKNRRVELWLR